MNEDIIGVTQNEEEKAIPSYSEEIIESSRKDDLGKGEEGSKDVLDEEPSPLIYHSERIPHISLRDGLRQGLAACITFCVVIQVGANMAFSSILIPQLNENNSTMNITRTQASWIASIVAIALPLGSIVIGPLMDIFGRKLMCILVSIPFTIAWLFQIYATDLWHLYVARIIAGSSGGLTTVAIVYVSEISHSSLRQAFLSLNSVFVSFGILLTYFFGTLIRWKLTAVLMCAISILTAVAMIFLPESTYWRIVFKNDYEGAGKSIRWLYDNREMREMQFKYLLLNKTKKTIRRVKESTRIQQFKSQIWMYTEKIVYKPTIILILIFFSQQITGGYVIIFYATEIFRKIDMAGRKHGVNEFSSLVFLGVTRFVFAIISAVISKNVGRRTLLIISGIGMAFFSFLAAAYIYFIQIFNDLDPRLKAYDFGFIFVVGYVAFGSLGFLVIPWTLIGELLPVKVRGVLGGALVSLAYVFMFIFVKIYPFISDTLDLYCIFSILSFLNLISVIFVYFFLPETLGRNFEEIEKYFE